MRLGLEMLLHHNSSWANMFVKNDRYNQGIYKPINPQKYRGKGYAIYRSGYELKFFKWCDMNSRVLEWGSENFVIPYLNPLDSKYHRYFVDNYVKIKLDNNIIEKYLIEISLLNKRLNLLKVIRKIQRLSMKLKHMFRTVLNGMLQKPSVIKRVLSF